MLLRWQPLLLLALLQMLAQLQLLLLLEPLHLIAKRSDLCMRFRKRLRAPALAQCRLCGECIRDTPPAVDGRGPLRVAVLLAVAEAAGGERSFGLPRSVHRLHVQAEKQR